MNVKHILGLFLFFIEKYELLAYNMNEVCMNKFKELRKNKGLTQVEFAKLLHVDQSTISKWEKNQALPDIQMIYKLSEIFNCSVDYILGREETPPPPSNKNTISIIGRGGGKKDIVLDDAQFNAIKTILENIAKENEDVDF